MEQRNTRKTYVGTVVSAKNDKTITDSSLEHDLFNLIDSMYDDKED